MQRLFSTFAGGWPGAGLLIQRLLVGVALLHWAGTNGGLVATQVLGTVAGLMLIAGLWTPFAGVLATCAGTWMSLSSPSNPVVPAGLAVLGLTLALIGPGEWSVDARLYGRKHIVPRVE